MPVANADELTMPRYLTKRFVPRMNRSVNFIGFGALEIGRDWGIGNQDERLHPNSLKAERMLLTVDNLGINVIDTANAYHLSQSRIGDYFKKHPLSRNKFMLNTKVGESSLPFFGNKCLEASYDNVYCNKPATTFDFSSAAIAKNIETSIKSLGVTKLDTVFLHLGSDARKVINDKIALNELKKLQKEGKLRYIGVSADDPELIQKCINSGDFDAIEVEYNLLNRANEEVIKLAHKKGLAVFIRGALGTGALTPKIKPYLNEPNLPFSRKIKKLLQLCNNNYEKLIALELAFLYHNQNITTVLIGTSNKEHLIKDVKLLDNFNDYQLLAKAVELTKNNVDNNFTDSLDNYFAKESN